MFIVPELELKALNLAVNAENELQEEDIKSADKNVLWTINYDRFNREFRDQARLFGNAVKLCYVTFQSCPKTL